MTLSEIITVVGILLATLVTCANAYMQRRLMRQIELFRRDPNVGLLPPPPVLIVFLKNEWMTMLIILITVSALIFAGIWPDPSLSLPILFGILVLQLAVLHSYWLGIRYLYLVKEIVSLIDEHIELTKRIERRVRGDGGIAEIVQ